MQLCTGQEAGCEATVHATHKIFDEDDAKFALLVDAVNELNCLNPMSALLNTQFMPCFCHGNKPEY